MALVEAALNWDRRQNALPHKQNAYFCMIQGEEQ